MVYSFLPDFSSHFHELMLMRVKDGYRVAYSILIQIRFFMVWKLRDPRRQIYRRREAIIQGSILHEPPQRGDTSDEKDGSIIGLRLNNTKPGYSSRPGRMRSLRKLVDLGDLLIAAQCCTC